MFRRIETIIFDIDLRGVKQLNKNNELIYIYVEFFVYIIVS